MKIKNKKTGIVWDVKDPKHIEKLKNNSNFEVIKAKSESTDDDLILKTKKELIKMAEEKGIEVDEKMKKADIVESLQ